VAGVGEVALDEVAAVGGVEAGHRRVDHRGQLPSA
jgi:hypothetical protein